MKTNRKNNTKQIVKWPTSPYFTMEDIFKINLDIVKITTRSKVSRAIKEGKTIEIGHVPGGKGRPLKVYSLCPVTQETLSLAERGGIVLVDNSDKLVHVISVSSANTVSTHPTTIPTNVTVLG